MPHSLPRTARAAPGRRPRRLALLLVLVVVAAPASGCLTSVNPFVAGFGPAAWPLEVAGVEALHKDGLSGEGVKVAIIDTGIDAGHKEFEGLTIEWADLVNQRRDPYDDNGHGTHVAGIVAAQGVWRTTLNGFYLQGVAPGADLIVIKAIGADGRGDEATVAQAVRLAVDHEAHIIILSLGGGSLPLLGTETERAVDEAVSAGVFVVAAAGNAPSGRDSCNVTSPASKQRVIAVGAVNEDKELADFSCRGSAASSSGPLPGVGGIGGTSESDPHRKPEVVAPGVAILNAWCTESCKEPAEYVEASGTSQAAPIVGGVIALLLEAHPELKRSTSSGDQHVISVKEAIMRTSAKIGPLDGKSKTAHDPGYGYGLIDGEALEAAFS